ncbi:MAG: tyrosine-type recombinase/integrase [Sphingomonadaceae bacterium]
MGKLTKRVVDALIAPPARETFAWDSELRGFGVRVKPTGGKAYFVQYRNIEGRTRRLILGKHGALTVEQARGMARQKLAAAARGEDPSQERHALRQGLTIGDICDWYLEHARSGRILGRRRRPIKPSTLDMDESRIATHIRPLIGSRSIRGLTLWDIEGMQAAIVAGKTAKSRKGRGGVTTGGPGVAARAVGTLRSILGHALRLGLIEKNPAAGVRLVASTPKSRSLSFAEIKLLGRAMREAAAEGEHPIGLAAIRLALLTGFRRMEVLGMQRSWVYGPEGHVRFPDTKTGPQIRAIGPAAARCIADLPHQPGSPYLFPADWGDGHFVGAVRVFERVCERAGITGATLHTLRHTFASVAGNLNFSELTIKGLLGHSPRGVTQGYVHLDFALVMAAERVSSQMDALLSGRAIDYDADNLRHAHMTT